jgi:hypothetical protein
MADACTIVKAQSQFAMLVTTRRVNLFRDKATISCAPVPALLLLLIEHSRCERLAFLGIMSTRLSRAPLPGACGSSP